MGTNYARWVCAAALLAACGSSDNPPTDRVHPDSGVGQAGTAGTNPPTAGVTAGVSVSLAGTVAPPVAGVGASGVSGAGLGGAAGMPVAGRTGRGGAGRGSAAGGGAAGSGAAGMAGSATAGSGGAAGGCAQNLTCQLTAPASTGDVHQDCVDRINQFRTQCACLPALTRWNDGEACADMMAMYDSTGTTAHAGFMARICAGGNAQNECPGWPSEAQVVSGCLQSMWNEGPPNMTPCDGTCFQTYGHFINMTSTRNKKVACGFFKTSAGKYWSVQNFSP